MKQDLIQTYDMLPSGGTVLCAVSGGADSMCLLAWLLELGPKYGCAVAAAHYNHGLRGAQGDADEAFVRDWCAGHSVPFYAGRGDVASAAKEHGWSIEEAGRNLRYAFLSETAEQIGALRVATAHNRGDNAETVLLNLIRGTGLTGLSGIAPVRGIFVRPLLDTPRQEIEDYLADVYKRQVVLVAVGDKQAADTLGIFHQIRHIRDDHVDAVHVVAGKGHAAVHHDDVAAVFVNGQVLADLIETAKGYDLDFFCHERTPPKIWLCKFDPWQISARPSAEAPPARRAGGKKPCQKTRRSENLSETPENGAKTEKRKKCTRPERP